MPRIFGPRIFPSNYCNNSINIRKYIPFIGSASAIRTALGIAPIYGPKNGITLVTPTITLTSIAYGIFKIDVPIKHKIPIMIDLSSFQ